MTSDISCLKEPVSIKIEKSTFDLMMELTKGVKCHMLTEYDERLKSLLSEAQGHRCGCNRNPN